MQIKWNEVTTFSKACALAMVVVLPVIGFCLGTEWGALQERVSEGVRVATSPVTPKSVSGSTFLFTCDHGKAIVGTFYPSRDTHADLLLSDGRKLVLPLAISASGARYANADESIVFWNKGNTAFITEGSVTTFSGCVTP